MEKDPQAFLNMQKEYGVNAIFAAAVTMIENGGGTNLQIGGDNYFSQKNGTDGGWRQFNGVQDAVNAFGKNIAKGSYYYNAGIYDVRTIGPVYCERTAGDKQWEDYVVEFMTKALKKSEEEGY